MNHTNAALKALFETALAETDPKERAKQADALMNTAVHDMVFLMKDADYPDARAEGARIYNGHAWLRKAWEEQSLATRTEITEILAAQRLIRLAEDGPVSFGRQETERLELCARILCAFKGLDYDRLNAITDTVPSHDAARDPAGFCKELTKTRNKPITPGPA